jgi:hypothetical protein
MTNAQRKAVTEYRRRRRGDGVVRVEVQVPAIDAQMVRDLAAILRGQPDAAQALRGRLRSIAPQLRTVSVFDIFGSDLPDSCFEGVCDRSDRGDAPRDIEF